MGDKVTKEDLRQFGLVLIDKIRSMMEMPHPKETETVEVGWLKARVVRKMLDISPGSLQNLRITGKVKFKKVLGSYYYSKADLMRLFNDEQKHDGPPGIK
jgi:hypothetical protein